MDKQISNPPPASTPPWSNPIVAAIAGAIAGAILAGAATYLLFGERLANVEGALRQIHGDQQSLVRGHLVSEAPAVMEKAAEKFISTEGLDLLKEPAGVVLEQSILPAAVATAEESAAAWLAGYKAETDAQLQALSRSLPSRIAQGPEKETGVGGDTRRVCPDGLFATGLTLDSGNNTVNVFCRKPVLTAQ